jgi:hypothetical protein
VGNEDRSFVDPKLLGVWNGPVGDHISQVHILPSSRPSAHPASKGMDILFIAHPPPEDPSDHGWLLAHGFAARIGDRTYLSVKWDVADGEPQTGADSGYHILEYIFEGDASFRFRTMNEDAIADAVRDGDLEGTVSEGQFLKSIRLTAQPDALRAFLAEGDPDTLFGIYGEPLVRAEP